MTILASLDLVEFRHRLFEFFIEEPLRVNNLTHGYGLFIRPDFPAESSGDGDPRPTNLTAVAMADSVCRTTDNAVARLSGSRPHLRCRILSIGEQNSGWVMLPVKNKTSRILGVLVMGGEAYIFFKTGFERDHHR
jgi:hypothetical protein